MNAIRTHSKDLTYDINGDGKVDIADARYLALQFTNPGGASCGPVALKRAHITHQN
jgi:hypothetical protein